MNGKIELNRCPICKSEGHIDTIDIYHIYTKKSDRKYTPCCHNAYCIMCTVKKRYDTPEEAAKDWNTISQRSDKVPRKPEKSDSGMFYICPNCNVFIEKNERAHGNIDIPFCKWCGQKLDWSDANAKSNS